MEERAFQASDRTLLFSQGDPVEHVFLLLDGAVQLSHGTETGFSTVVKLVVAPGLVGVAEAVANETEHLVTAHVAGGARLARIDRDTFLEQITYNGHLAEQCLSDLAASMCQSARLELARSCSTEQRLASLLLAYVSVFGELDENGTRIRLRRSQAELAGAVGSGERSVNRVVSSWRQNGVLQKRGGHYTVTDLRALEELARDLQGALVHRGDGSAQSSLSRSTRRTLASN